MLNFLGYQLLLLMNVYLIMPGLETLQLNFTTISYCLVTVMMEETNASLGIPPKGNLCPLLNIFLALVPIAIISNDSPIPAVSSPKKQ